MQVNKSNENHYLSVDTEIVDDDQHKPNWHTVFYDGWLRLKICTNENKVIHT